MLDITIVGSVLAGVFFGTLLAWFARWVIVYCLGLLEILFQLAKAKIRSITA